MEPPEDESEARLILAWTNLGALIEVTLKLFLSAFLIDYRGDENAVKRKNGEIIDPDTLKLDSIRHFFDKNDLWTTEWSQFVLMVQQYRNAIHSFRDRSLGDFDKFWDAVRTYKSMIQEFNFDRLPYPDARYWYFQDQPMLNDIQQILTSLLAHPESEVVEFKEAKNVYDMNLAGF